MHNNGWRRLQLALLLTVCVNTTWADDSVWIGKPSNNAHVHGGHGDGGSYIVLQGDYPNGNALDDEAGVDDSALLVDPEGQTQPANFMPGMLHYKTPLKGHHWLFFERRRVADDTLDVTLAKYRFYNAKGDVRDSVVKEIRGRTIDSKFDRPPLEALPFELVMLPPEKEHHISCCLFSGDLARVRVYYRQQPLAGATLQLTTNDGWQHQLKSDADGIAAFELPLTTRVNTEREKFAKRTILITAHYDAEESGSLNGQPYHQVRYTMTMPIMFHPSALEWAAKAPAFALVVVVVLVLGLGIFLYRLRLRKRRYLS